VPNNVTFPLFPKLSLELRIMIWEQSWPEPRLIEAGLCILQSDEEGVNSDEEGVDSDEEGVDNDEESILQPGKSFSTALKGDLGCRVLEEVSFEKILEPVALQVCQESRSGSLHEFFHSLQPTLPCEF
jgi:2EXR family